jgi:hypothetical protein
MGKQCLLLLCFVCALCAYMCVYVHVWCTVAVCGVCSRGHSYAVLALANLAATLGNHPAIVEEGALPAMFSLSNSAGTVHTPRLHVLLKAHTSAARAAQGTHLGCTCCSRHTPRLHVLHKAHTRLTHTPMYARYTTHALPTSHTPTDALTGGCGDDAQT